MENSNDNESSGAGDIQGMHVDTEHIEDHAQLMPIDPARERLRTTGVTPGISDMDEDKLTEEEKKKRLRRQEQVTTSPAYHDD